MKQVLYTMVEVKVYVNALILVIKVIVYARVLVNIFLLYLLMHGHDFSN